MKRHKNAKQAMVIQRIQTDAQKIASEANFLAEVAKLAPEKPGNFSRRLRHLQERVDRLRRILWRVQSSGDSQVLPFPSETRASAGEPSLVDRVLALIDRRCG